MNRQSKGQNRETYNAAINKIPGLYNQGCKVEIAPLEGSKIEPYDFFNLTTQMRTTYLHNQFEILESQMKD